MIELGSWTTLESVLKWRSSATQTIRLTRSSSFEPGALGVAVSALRAISRASTIFVECSFQAPTGIESLANTPFFSAFGYSLARLASTITFADQRQDLTSEFKSLLAKAYKEKQGCFASGTLSSIFSADPHYKIPPCLAELRGSAEEVYLRSHYQRLLQQQVKGLGFERMFSEWGQDWILDLVFELFQNTEDHARPTSEDSFKRSIRAITLEKLSSPEPILRSRELSPYLKGYLTRVTSDPRWELGLGFLFITVSDQGRGIHSTLGRKGAESVSECFARAFRPGESRKPSGETERGAGLDRAARAAFELEGCIHVVSGGLRYVHDFSFESQKYPGLLFKDIESFPNLAESGTSFTVVIPEYRADPAQNLLPFGTV